MAVRLTVIFASILVVTLVLLMEPLQGYLPPCQFHAWTGYSCPSCGLTRSLHALLHGDVPAAFGFHPLGPGIGFALAALNLLLICDLLLGRRLKLSIPQCPKRAMLTVVVGLGLCLWMGSWAAKLKHENHATCTSEVTAVQDPPSAHGYRVNTTRIECN